MRRSCSPSKPASSSIFLAFLERYVMSPLSMRMPAGRKPSALALQLKTRMAFGTPDFNTLYVSTSSVQLRIFLGIRLKCFVFAVKKLYPAVRHGAERRNAETAVADGAGSADAAADICGTRAAEWRRRKPCARREPNSITALPSAARTIRFVFVAMRLWWLMDSKTMVSTNCA